MKRVYAAVGAVVVLASLGLVFLVVWAIVRGVEKDPGVVGAVVGAVFPIVGGLLLASYQRRGERQQEFDRLHREEMEKTYKSMVTEFLLRDPTVPLDDAKLTEFFKAMSTQLLIYGPESIVRAWLDWKAYANAVTSPPTEGDPSMLLRYEEVLFAVRADLGHKDKQLKQGDLLRLILKDFDADLAAWAATQAPAAEGGPAPG